MKNITTIILTLMISLSCVHSQYYNETQLNTIHSAQTASEGDLYLDTVNEKYYIGLTHGKLGRLLTFEQQSFCELLKPIISTGAGSSCTKFFTSSTDNITINGFNFSSSTTVEVTGQTVVSTSLVSPNELTVNVTSSGTVGQYDIIVENVCGSDTLENGFETVANSWLDLRSGGDAFTLGTDIRVRPGMGMTRDGTGMRFTGSNPWNSWVKFESEQFARGNCTTTEWIFRMDGAMMVGISGLTTNEASGSQWQEGAVVAYFSSATAMNGYYGSSPTNGATWTLNENETVTNGGILKVKIESDGENGSNLTVYQLPSAADAVWDDESNVIVTSVSTNGNTQTPLVPFIIPRNTANCYFIALRTY